MAHLRRSELFGIRMEKAEDMHLLNLSMRRTSRTLIKRQIGRE
jgi:hypothetical protein